MSVDGGSYVNIDGDDVYSVDKSYNRWTSEQAKEWHQHHNYKAGVNFIPSYACNQLEMFQDETYDPVTIDRELSWAETLGFNILRVYLHHLLWEQYQHRFVERLEHFLDISSSRGFVVIFVLFDSCWNKEATVGTQPTPIQGQHNSCWLQCPGEVIIHDSEKFDSLKAYVQVIMTHFQYDTRVICWDIWNEPNNSGYLDIVINPLLKKAFSWARDVSPSQPLTTGIWQTMVREVAKPFQRLQLQLSDVITFHCYDTTERLLSSINFLQQQEPHRPLLCTEYMARAVGSRFDPQLSLLKERNIWAINWGLVAGKTQTNFPWASVEETNNTIDNPTTSGNKPAIWFHDIFRPDGSPYSDPEVQYIQSTLLVNSQKHTGMAHSDFV